MPGLVPGSRVPCFKYQERLDGRDEPAMTGLPGAVFAVRFMLSASRSTN
jgi:hypothetical protein